MDTKASTQLHMTKCILALGCLSVAGLGASSAFAQIGAQADTERRTNITFTVGAGNSDNVFRNAAQETSATYSAAGVVLDINRATERLIASVTGNLEYRNFSTAGLRDEPYGDLSASAEFRAVPDRFSWIVTNQFGQGRNDPFQAFAPDNLQQINIFATGPALYLPLGERSQVRLSTMAGQRSYGDSVGFDSDTLESSAGFFRQLSTTSEIGLNFVTRDVEYDSPVLDNTIDRAFVSYDKQLANGNASLQVGSNRVEFENRSSSNPFFDVGWRRDLSARTNVEFTVVKSLVDASDNFRGGQDFDDTIATTDVFERTTGGGAVTINAGRSVIGIAARFGEERYENDITLDNDLVQFNVSFDRTVSRNMIFGAEFLTVERDFAAVDQQGKDSRTTLGFQRLLGRQSTLSVDYLHTQRSGRNAGGSDENTIRILYMYSLNTRAALQ